MRYIFLVSGAKIKKRRANYGHTFIINVCFYNLSYFFIKFPQSFNSLWCKNIFFHCCPKSLGQQ